MKTTIRVIVTGFLSGLAGSYAGIHYFMEPAQVRQAAAEDYRAVTYDSKMVNTPPNKTTSEKPAASPVAPSTIDFSDAAARSTPSVVYINSISQGVSYSNWDWFFGEGATRQTQGSIGLNK